MDLDSIDEKTAFKMGFAARCFEMGLEPDQVKAAMEKSALLPVILGGTGTGIAKLLGKFAPGITNRLVSGYSPVAKTVGPYMKSLGLLGGGAVGHSILSGGAANMLKDLGGWGIGLGGGLGLLGGAGLGYGMAKLREENVDEDEVKAKELADTYKVYTDRLKAQRAYQQYRRARESS